MKNFMGQTEGKNKTNKGKCLDEVQLVSYVLQIYPDKERREIEEHLNRCQRCFDEMVSLVKAGREIKDEAKWMKKSAPSEWKDIIRNRSSIVLRMINEKWELVRATGEILKPSLAVRGGKGTEKKDAAACSKALPALVEYFNGYRVEVKIEEGQTKTLTIYLRVNRVKDETPVRNITFTLMDEQGQKILTELTRDGFISFDGLKKGEYSIKMVRSKELIGAITLDLRENKP